MKTALMALLAAAAMTTPAFAQDAHGAHDPAAAHGHAHADFESGRFHVRVDGPDQPVGDVILIPGLSSSPEVWDALTHGLKGRYRVHRIHVQFNDPRMTSEITDGIYRASFANMPSAELKRIDDSAHFIMLDQPAVFAAEVNAFLE